MWLLKIVLHSKFILFYENLLESDYIVLHIEHKHGFLVVQLIKIRDKSQQKRLRLSLFLSESVNNEIVAKTNLARTCAKFSYNSRRTFKQRLNL